jgi:RNA polymerase sigma-70 factor, ECF subfamily
MTVAFPVPDAQEKRTSFEREALVHLNSVYRVALRLTGNAADAEDLVQTTMLRAYDAWDQYQHGTNAKGWLLTILRHSFINDYRRRVARAETADVDTVERFLVFDDRPEADPESAFFDSLVDDDVTRAITELPVVYREVFLLTDFGELRYHETAAILSVPVGTVKSRLFRARKLLKARLRGYAASIGWKLGDTPKLKPTLFIDAVPKLARDRAPAAAKETGR